MASKQSDADREIAKRRAIFQPTPVNLHHIPRWFAQCLKPYRHRHDTTLEAFERMRRAVGDSWLDHWGSTKIVRRSGQQLSEETYFVSEPYGLSPQGVRALAELERVTGIRWSVEANSWWYPGRTLRIVIEPPRAAGSVA